MKKEENNTIYSDLHLESGDYPTTLNKKFHQRVPWQKADPGRVLAFMPGTVEQIMVKKGDKVRQGDLLLIFRAMKMENNILSPVDGKVKAIHAKKGVNLPKNAVLIEIG